MAKATNKKKSLEEMIEELNKVYKNNPIVTGDTLENYDDVVSTGSFGLDLKLGIGGLPISPKGKNGKIIEIVGWESSGKSTLTQTVIGNAQKRGLKVLLIDSENSLSSDYCVKLGVNRKDIYVIKFDEEGAEVCYEKMQELVETGELDLVVIDSYNAILPKKILTDGLDSSNMGLHARLMSKLLAKVNSYCTTYGTTFIFVGQYREKIGVLYGPTETTQGGNALKFYSHIRLETSRSVTIENSVFEGGSSKGEKLGNLHKVKISKNKLAAPFKKVEYDIIYGEGIDQIKELISLGLEYDIITQRMGNITYNLTKYTTEEFKKLLETEEFREQFKSDIKYAYDKKPIVAEIELPMDEMVEGLTNEMINILDK